MSSKWANWVDLLGLTVFDSFDHKTHVGKGGSGMPSLSFSTRYHKLDDTVFLLCRNCGHSLKKDEIKKMATATQARFRSSPKHFLTWSATAANHKIQKLSKNFVQNVSRFQSKVEKALNTPSHQSHQQWDPSCSENHGSNSPECHYNNNSSSGSSANLVGGISGVNVALVHTLNVTRNNLNNNNTSTPKGSEWRNAARLRRKFDFEVERTNLAGDMLELEPMMAERNEEVTVAATDEVINSGHETPTLVTGTFNLHASSSSNNTSLSTISIGATTLPVTSPHWSRASSLSNSMGSSPSPPQSGVESPSFNRRKKPKSDGRTCPVKSSSFDSQSAPLLQHQHQHSVSSLVDSPTTPEQIGTGSNLGTTELTVTIFEEEAELRHAPWFQAGIPREIALEVLKNEPVGSFIVRESTTKTGCFALSLRVPRDFQPCGIAHYLILKTVHRGYKIKGFTKEFKSLTSLITHHSVMPELLPCPLSLHLYRPKGSARVSRLDSDFEEPERLCTLRKYTDF